MPYPIMHCTTCKMFHRGSCTKTNICNALWEGFVVLYNWTRVTFSTCATPQCIIQVHFDIDQHTSNMQFCSLTSMYHGIACFILRINQCFLTSPDFLSNKKEEKKSKLNFGECCQELRKQHLYCTLYLMLQDIELQALLIELQAQKIKTGILPSKVVV